MRVLLVWLLATAAAFGQYTAKYPAATATWQDLLFAKGPARGTLTGAISDVDTAIPVSDGTQYASYSAVQIQEEVIWICSVVGNTLNVCTNGRGFSGTAAAAHGSGLAVRNTVTTHHHNQLAAEVKAIQDALGPNLSNVASSWDNINGKPTTFLFSDQSYTDPAWLTITKSKVGLGNVENTTLSTWPGSANITTLGTIASGTLPWERLSNIPTAFTPAAHSHVIGDLTTVGDWSSKITSGTYGINVTGSAGSVPWTGVSGRPTALSSFTNDSGYITSTVSGSFSASGQVGLMGGILGTSMVSLGGVSAISYGDGNGLFNIVLGGYQPAGGGGYIFSSTRGASRIRMHDGELQFYVGPTTGTAGSLIPWTSAMSIDSSANTTFGGQVAAPYFKANVGAPAAGNATTGYSFYNGGDADGGLFSTGDGVVGIYANSAKSAEFNGSGVVIPGTLDVSGAITGSVTGSAGSVAWSGVSSKPAALANIVANGWIRAYEVGCGNSYNEKSCDQGGNGYIDYTDSAGYATSAGNSDTVDSLHVSGGRNNSANQLARTDGNGYLPVTYVNSDTGQEDGTITQILTIQNSDGYYRKAGLDWASKKIFNARTLDANWMWQDDYLALPTGTVQWGVFTPRAAQATITEVWCWADADSTVIQLRRSDGGDMINGNLTCGSTAGASTNINGYGAIPVGYSVGMYEVSGSAKSIRVGIKYTVAY